MTVSNPTRAVTFTGNSVTTVFSYTFLIPAGTSVVTLTDMLNGEVEGDPLTEGVDYSITGEDDENGGTVTYPLSGSPLTSAFKLNIKSILTPTQTLDLTNQSAYNPVQLELQLDRLTLVQLQHAEQLNRAVIIASGSTSTADEVLDALAAVPAAAVAAVAAASSASADALAAAASEAAADADRITVAADKATVAADKATVAADKATVSADKATVAADKAIVAAYKAASDANAAATAVDAASTAADAISTAADVVLAEAAKTAAEAAAGSLTPVNDQINSAAVTTFLDADHIPARKASSGALIKDTWAAIKTAIWTAWGGLINAGTNKATPVGADQISLADSAAGNATKKATLTSLGAIFQPLKTILTTLGNLANASGVLTNDGAGNLSWASGGSSGTYTPTATLSTNATACTPAVCLYSRSGNVVTVSGLVNLDATVSGAMTVELTLPIASNFAATTDAAGLIVRDGGGDAGIIVASIANDKIVLTVANDGSGGVDPYRFMCQYLVI